MTPDQEKTTGGVSHTIWKVNEDAPGWTSHVDCHYRNTNRLVRLQTRGTTRCEYMTTGPASQQGIGRSLVCR